MPTVGIVADVVVEGAPLPMLADGGTETVSLFVEDVVDVVVLHLLLTLQLLVPTIL